MPSFSAPAIAAVGVGLSAAGTVASVIGSEQAAKAQSEQAAYQAQVAKNNQTIADQNAAYASEASNAQVTQAQLKQRSETGAVAAGLAANGLDINTGSPSQVRTAESEITQLNTENTEQQGALQIYGYRTSASNFGAQSGLFQQQASQAGTAGNISAVTGLLSGASSLASKWSDWQTKAGSTGLDNPAWGGAGP
jgi:hypothetical protein